MIPNDSAPTEEVRVVEKPNINFNNILHRTMKYEGGYVEDHAGPTNFGITQKTYDAYAKKYGLPPKSVKNLNYGEGKDLYKKEFYELPKINTLPEEIQFLVFDYGVNSGPRQAVKDLQRVVGVKDDGIIGPNTKKAVKNFIKNNGYENFKRSYVNNRAMYMQYLIETNPEKYMKYRNGWANRINDILSR